MTSTDSSNRARILAEALRLFAHNGYGSTSVREIVEASGVTKPTLYYHFGNKEQLFRAVVQGQLDALAERVDHAVRGPGPVVERLRAFLEAYLLGALRDLDAVRLMMTCSLPSSEGQPDCDVIARHLRTLGPLSDLVREGVERGELRADLDPTVAVTSLVGAANLHLVAAVNGASLDASTVDAITDLWLHGVSR